MFPTTHQGAVLISISAKVFLCILYNYYMCMHPRRPCGECILVPSHGHSPTHTVAGAYVRAALCVFIVRLYDQSARASERVVVVFSSKRVVVMVRVMVMLNSCS